MAELAERLDRVIERGLEDNRIVGTVLTVLRHGEPTYQRAAGLADRENDQPMKEDAIFRIASVTKPIVAATALALIERGVLGLDRPITEWLPEFQPRLQDGYAPSITIRHLLTHTSGFGYALGDPGDPYTDVGVSGGMDQPGLAMEENLKRIQTAPLYFEPGSEWRYGVSIDVLGAVIAKATDSTLGEAVSEHVTGPLGMTDTAFGVTDMSRLTTPYADNPGGSPILMADPQPVRDNSGRDVVFSPSRILDPTSFQSGGGGMASTAKDIVHFLETIRTGGGPILKPETVDESLTNQIGTMRQDIEPGAGFGFLSAVVIDPEVVERPLPYGTARWGGIYGHDWFIDRTGGYTVLSLTNTAVEGCMGAYRDWVIEAVYGD